MSRMQNIKVGDLVYAVGPTGDRLDLCVYSAVVKNVRLEGTYSENATSEDYAGATYAIELADDRPVHGFPKWTYSSYALGVSIHRSALEALRAHGAHAQQRRDQAEYARASAQSEVDWVAAQVALTEVAS